MRRSLLYVLMMVVAVLQMVGARRELYVTFSGQEASVSRQQTAGNDVGTEPIEAAVVECDGAHVRVHCSECDSVWIYLSGASDDGSLVVDGTAMPVIVMDNLSLANKCGGAIASYYSGTTTIVVSGSNTLGDGAERDPELADIQRACITAAGELLITGRVTEIVGHADGWVVASREAYGPGVAIDRAGDGGAGSYPSLGTLRVEGNYKHGIYSDKRLEVRDCSINVKSAKNDGLRGKKKVTLDNVSVTTDKTGKHAVNSDDASVNATGCRFDITLRKSGAKGIAATKDIKCSDSEIRLKLSANATKGLKGDADILLSGVTINAEATGGLNITADDKSYCSIIKCDGNLSLSGCTAEVRHHGEGGKGFCCDSLMTLEESTIDMLLTGDGAPYLIDMGEELDYFSPRCLESKGNMTVLSGRYSLHTTGTGGKGIVCDSVLVIGRGTRSATGRGTRSATEALGRAGGSTEAIGHAGPMIDIVTEGTAVVNDIYEDQRFGCPKAIRCGKDMFVEGGTITATTGGMGGEGIESKGHLTINGGVVVCETYDDGINVGEGITVNGGYVYCASSDNDGIDSNGFIHLAGGVVASLTSHDLDEDFDCDDDSFVLDGGTVFGIGRDYSGIYHVSQPYVQHIAFIKDRVNHRIDTIAPNMLHRGHYVTFTDSSLRPVMTVFVHRDIPCAFTTLSSPAFGTRSATSRGTRSATDRGTRSATDRGTEPIGHAGGLTEVYVFERETEPSDMEEVVPGRVWVSRPGTEPINHADPVYGRLVFADVATMHPFAESVAVDTVITLHRGWNLISPSVVGGMDLQSLAPAVMRVKNDDAETIYDPYTQLFTGDITHMDIGKGYMVEMAGETTVRVTGMSLPVALNYHLQSGHNLIGYGGATALPVEDAISDTFAAEGDYISDHTDFAVYTCGRWVGTLRTIQPGCGYHYITDKSRIIRFGQ